MARGTGVYLCRCGGLLADRLDFDALERELSAEPGVAYVNTVELACSEDGKSALVEELRERRPERVVVAACSPRDHEETFRGVLERAFLNPFLVQLANVREHAAWVTPEIGPATAKALSLVRGALRRVAEQVPLERRFLEVSTDVLVLGGGPAGLQATLTLVEAGRKVTLVEKSPILGGLPVRCEELFPKLECAPCALEPPIADVLREAAAGKLELLLTSELETIVGSFGNFVARVRREPRGVDVATCVGCAGCIEACPATLPNPVNGGRGTRKAMDFVFFGGLPNVPHIQREACLRSHGEACELCREICPVEGAVRLDDEAEVVERRVGAIVVATGGALGHSALASLGRDLPDVLTSFEFERLLAANGPTQGGVQLADGRAPGSVAFLHCAGSLDPGDTEYCSGVCCLEAFKFNAMLAHRLPGVPVTHYARTLVAPGKEEARLMREALERPTTSLVTHAGADPPSIAPASGGRKRVSSDGGEGEHDLVVLMPPLVPSPDAPGLAAKLGLRLDATGFFEERHGRVDATRSTVRGIFLAGTCRAPMDLGRAMTEGASAAGLALAALVPGRRLELKPVHAEVDEPRCSGCRTCGGVCPYGAVGYDVARRVATVDPALCEGCGTCVAACPSSAMVGRGFTDAQIGAEVAGVLA